jgi:hypothetical protein
MQRARAAGASSGRRQPPSPSPGILKNSERVCAASQAARQSVRTDSTGSCCPGQAQPASSLVPLCCRVASFLPSRVDLLPTCVLGAHCGYQPARCVRRHAALRSAAELALACTTASGHSQRSRSPRRSTRAAPARAIAALQAAPEVPSRRQGSAAPARSPGLGSAHTRVLTRLALACSAAGVPLRRSAPRSSSLRAAGRALLRWSRAVSGARTPREHSVRRGEEGRAERDGAPEGVPRLLVRDGAAPLLSWCARAPRAAPRTERAAARRFGVSGARCGTSPPLRSASPPNAPAFVCITLCFCDARQRTHVLSAPLTRSTSYMPHHSLFVRGCSMHHRR